MILLDGLHMNRDGHKTTLKSIGCNAVYLYPSPSKFNGLFTGVKDIEAAFTALCNQKIKSVCAKIQDGYFEYMKSRTDIKILIIDSEKIDFVNKEEDYIFIKNLIFNKQYSKGITRILEHY